MAEHWIVRTSRALLCAGALLAGAPAAAQLDGPRLIESGERRFASGDYPQAIADWTGALRDFERRGDRPGRIAALGKRAEAYRALGFLHKSIEDLRAAIRLAEAAPGPSPVAGLAPTLAHLRGSLATSLLLSDEPALAREELDACLAEARRRGDGALQARALNSLGNLLAVAPPSPAPTTYPDQRGGGRRTGPSPAISPRQAYRRSYQLALDHALPDVAATARLNEARAARAEGAPEAARGLAGQAAAAFQALPDSALRAMGLVGAGLLLTDLGAGEPARGAIAYAALHEARRTAQAVGDRVAQSYATGYLGHLYETRGRQAEALILTRQALFLATEAQAPEVAYLWQWQGGRLYRALDDAERALPAYRAAVATLRSVRSDLRAGQGGYEFSESVGRLYLELADLLLERSGREASEAAQQEALAEARATMELLKAAELEDYFQDDCVARLRTKTRAIDERLPAGTAALYTILFPDRVELLVSLSGKIARTTVPVPGARVTEQVRAFRRFLEKDYTFEYLAPAKLLHEWLIRPIEPVLDGAGVHTLVFVPGDSLRTIPLSALHDGQRHLVEKYAVAVTPGLTLLDPQPLRSTRVELLIAGLTEARDRFPPLPYVAAELDAVHALFGGRLYKDGTFRLESVKAALEEKPYSIVHLATHAEFAADGKSSFLLTYDGRLSMNGLEEFVKLSRFRDEPVELLTLSACTTAAGDDRAALGLAGVGIKAGARSALASLWLINDAAAAELVSHFYRNLKAAKLSKAQALRAAQMRLLADDQTRHPYFWAPFLLIGNWL